MAGAELRILQRMRSLLGSDGLVESDSTGRPRVSPRSEAAAALVFRAAAASGWKVRIDGAGTWMPPDAPCELVVTTDGLDELTFLNPADLVATVQAGMLWTDLRNRLADRGVWVAADPPGEERTVGSVIATGTAGALRAGFGAIRDHLLGLTFVSGDGRVIKAGGRVVKNVAGYDLTKLISGSFGTFGMVTSVHLRLRAVPREDATLLASGARDALLDEARTLLEAGSTPAALELLSPLATGAREWVLAVRLIGTPAEVRAQRDDVRSSVSCALDVLETPDAARFWRGLAAGLCQEPITIRLGVIPQALDDALDLVGHHLSSAHHLSEDWVAVTVPAGSVRWCGTSSPDRLRLLRHAAAQREIPLTVERAPWTIREEVGHFGAYREGVARLVNRLRHAFDPSQVLVTAVGNEG